MESAGESLSGGCTFKGSTRRQGDIAWRAQSVVGEDIEEGEGGDARKSEDGKFVK